MASAVFLLCALTSIVCAGLLLRAYRVAGGRLLLGALICFVGLAINNVLLAVDEIALPHHQIHWRVLPAIAGMFALLWTLIVEET